jgi:phage terminase large subunit-like protein
LLRKKQNPHKYFIPNGKTEEFINMVGNDNTFICLFSAANGVGKTACGCNLLAHIMYGLSGNKYFDLPLFKKFPYPKQGRIVSDATTIIETTVPELKKWLPFGRYKANKGGKNYERKWITDTGFKFDLMTYDQGVKEFESATLGWAWFDEPPPLAIFKATVARMRRGGIIFITATPLTGSAWMYDHILTYKGDGGQRDFVEAGVSCNCIKHGIRGILEHEDIEKMIAEYDEEDMQARVYGKFQHLIGIVFKAFKRKIHVIKPFSINPRDFVVMFVAVDRKGNKYITDELYDNFKTFELAERIHKIEDRHRIELRIADPAAFVKNQHDDNPEEETLAGKLSDKYDLEFVPASKNRTQANRAIKDALDYEMAGDEMVIAPEIYIFDTCLRTIYELEHLQWDDWRGKAAERKNPLEKPMDKDDHMIENLGRILLLDPQFIPMPTKIQRSIGVKKNFDCFD